MDLRTRGKKANTDKLTGLAEPTRTHTRTVPNYGCVKALRLLRIMERLERITVERSNEANTKGT